MPAHSIRSAHHRGTRALTALALVLTSVCIAAGPGTSSAAAAVPNPDPTLISQWKPCEPDTGVTVIVDFQSLGDHTVKVGCAAGDQASGVAALTNAGFGISGTKQYGDNFICRIDNLPGPQLQDCQSTPPSNAYWSYWIAAKPHDAWGYSSVGAGDPSNHPAKGSIQGWAFSTEQGTTVQPRLAAVDGTGPASNQPAPLPTAAASIATALAWLDPASRALITNAGDDLPLFIGGLVATAQARLQAGASAGDIADLMGVIRAHTDDYVSDQDPGTQQFDPGAGARLLLLLTTLHDPGDTTLIASLTGTLRGLVIPTGDPADPSPYAGGFYSTVRENGSKAGVAFPDVQSLSLQALLAGDGHVPAVAVNALLSQQLPSGVITLRNCGDEDTDLCNNYGPNDTYLTVGDTAQALLALTAVRAAGTSSITGGTVDLHRLERVITKAISYLHAQQHADGGFTGSYPGSGQSVWLNGRGAGYETVLTTSVAAQALAAAGQDTAAREAARWIATVQLTDNTHPPASVRGLVSPDPNLFTSYAANGLGYDPLTVGPDSFTQLSDLANVQIPDSALATVAWAAAPYRDATITKVASGAVTTTAASVTVTVTRGSDPQQLTVTYGTPSGTTRTTTTAKTVAAGTGTAAITFRLTGLQPSTTYNVQATSVGGGPTTTSEVAYLRTRGTPVITGRTADLRAAVAYLTANLVEGDHYETVPGFPDVGLSIDGAFALAAADTRGLHTGDAALRRITTFVATHGNAWTGIGTRYVSGGSLGKMALLAEVLGTNPRAFAGRDLIAALDTSVCATASRPPDTRCSATGNYSYSASVFSQALGIIAQLRAKDPAGAARPVAYLESLQNADGGFPALLPPGVDAPSDVDSTAIAAMALNLLPTTTARTAVARANAWLATQQLADGGFPGAAGDSTNSAALAVQGLTLDRTRYGSTISNALAFLGNQQNTDGGFRVASAPFATDATAPTVDTSSARNAATTGATASDLRATTQVVNGLVTTSYATLSLGPPGSGSASGGAGGNRTPVQDEPSTRSTAGSSSGSLAGTGVDSLAQLQWALALIAAGAAVLLTGRGRRIAVSTADPPGHHDPRRHRRTQP